MKAERVWCRFISRPNRFVVLCRCGRRQIRAHLPNSGRLTGVLLPGVPLLLERAPHTKTGYRAVAARLPSGILTSLNAHLPNHQFEKILPYCFPGHRIIGRNPRIAGSVLDFLLESPLGEEIAVEVKSCTLVEDGVALFPDGVTVRGARQMQDMARHVGSGGRAAVCVVVQREDAQKFAPNAAVDPNFAHAFHHALQKGVSFRLVICRFDAEQLIPSIWGAEELLVQQG